jgi:predicted AlkP superfamily pyrophosphatase or phosphodiesterase
VTPLVAPAYGAGSLGDLLSAVLSSLGVSETGAAAATATTAAPASPAATASPISLPEASRVCVLLVDGLGYELLASADPSDAPFLLSLMPTGRSLDAGFPTSTPISLCSLGTGRTPGEHGIVGFTMHVPPVPHVLECLAWTEYGTRADLSDALPPESLQPCETLVSVATLSGVASTVVSLSAHVGSGLTRAAFRGATFHSIPSFDDLGARLALITAGLRRSDQALVYTYDARLDTAAHVEGVGSNAWRTALRATDDLASAIAGVLPEGTLMLVTGDHGAVNVPPSARVDLDLRPDLARDVAWLSGDPRTRHVHATAGRAEAVAARWKDGLPDAWAVLTRDEAIDAGLFGPVVRTDVRPRIGDVVAIATGGGALFDRSRFPWELRLAAFHGALTSAELRVPLLQVLA